MFKKFGPRIIVNTGEIESPKEYSGKWAAEVSMWDVGGERQIMEPYTLGPFETQAEALKKGREVVEFISKKLEKEITGEAKGEYLDLKNGGVMRNWDEH